ncbi:MAG: hypothetical protein HY812_21855 [Planctomycetes bacterium]|nr:hypothetical protein [Planctomycetota bacterium]
MQAAARDLLVGVGNPSRTDDRAGHVVVALAAARLPAADCLVVQQLDVAHVAALAAHRRVVIADASVEENGPDARLRPIAPRRAALVHGHVLSPEALLFLAREIAGRAPQAWLASVRGRDFSFGETLTAACGRAAAEAAELVVELLRE